MLVRQLRIYRDDLRSNPNVLYVFGDNERRIGFGGQAAEMRGEPNAIGVATLTAPGVFWTEEDALRQMEVLDKDFQPVFTALYNKKVVVLPSDGIGTGLADLATRSPTTFARLQLRVEQMKVLGQ